MKEKKITSFFILKWFSSASSIPLTTHSKKTTQTKNKNEATRHRTRTIRNIDGRCLNEDVMKPLEKHNDSNCQVGLSTFRTRIEDPFKSLRHFFNFENSREK